MSDPLRTFPDMAETKDPAQLDLRNLDSAIELLEASIAKRRAQGFGDADPVIKRKSRLVVIYKSRLSDSSAPTPAPAA